MWCVFLTFESVDRTKLRDESPMEFHERFTFDGEIHNRCRTDWRFVKGVDVCCTNGERCGICSQWSEEMPKRGNLLIRREPTLKEAIVESFEDQCMSVPHSLELYEIWVDPVCKLFGAPGDGNVDAEHEYSQEVRYEKHDEPSSEISG